MTSRTSQKRRPAHSASKAIRQWMLERDVIAVEIAGALKVGQSAITHFINGAMTSGPIREYFLAIGCPAELMRDLDALRETLRRQREMPSTNRKIAKGE